MAILQWKSSINARFQFAQFGDVRDVMATVPGIKEKQPVWCAGRVQDAQKTRPY
jgi:hypothetical protein